MREQADEALAGGCITAEENTKIRNAFPVDFYTTNFFICVGLFLLTVVIVTCSLGLLFLISAAGSSSFTPLLIFSGLVCYGALEFVVYKRRHFRSGVDYGLFWMSAGLLYSALFLTFDNMSSTSQCITICTISLLFTIRFANSIMALIAYAALLAFIFSIVRDPGGTVQLVVPFIIMSVSAITWFFSVRLYENPACRHYRQSLRVIMAATLASFYLAGNYFVVSEIAGLMLGISRNSGGSISMGWFFWMLTLATPLLYLYYGIRKKNHIYLWAGLILITATIFTVRHYYSVLSAEWAMIFGGVVSIVVAYTLIRKLRTPLHGITSLESSDKHLLEKLNIESLLIAETFAGASTAPVANNDFQFGGGSGGGGGAGGQY